MICCWTRPAACVIGALFTAKAVNPNAAANARVHDADTPWTQNSMNSKAPCVERHGGCSSSSTICAMDRHVHAQEEAACNIRMAVHEEASSSLSQDVHSTDRLGTRSTRCTQLCAKHERLSSSVCNQASHQVSASRCCLFLSFLFFPSLAKHERTRLA